MAVTGMYLACFGVPADLLLTEGRTSILLCAVKLLRGCFYCEEFGLATVMLHS